MADAIDHLATATRVAADLAALPIPFALVGGIAVILHGRVRTTKDVDFAVQAATEADAEHVIHALTGRGYRIGAVMQQKLSGRLATVRLFTPASCTDEPDCDLLFGTCGIEAEIVRAARILPLPSGCDVPVATRAHVIAMKLLSERELRPNDRIDLVTLLASASRGEIAEVVVSIELITARGFARGKDLQAVLRGILADIGRSDALP